MAINLPVEWRDVSKVTHTTLSSGEGGGEMSASSRNEDMELVIVSLRLRSGRSPVMGVGANDCMAERIDAGHPQPRCAKLRRCTSINRRRRDSMMGHVPVHDSLRICGDFLLRIGRQLGYPKALGRGQSTLVDCEVAGERDTLRNVSGDNEQNVDSDKHDFGEENQDRTFD
ncbi:uncharacterized protein LACBIDRAFT_321105 [Laccaria bicolor S238N-H82]|uniref:Predicted protein n=1 Tax=Laccaria bicolor (strain S238N-H82 / ATCC MYA-4686) TaxID=486041 RepID=B0CNS5_LACBS|nr:uncharacterized protein LACBIDRAFT_321105 [Laccaria bicolor S238N-H82]EDR15988.1 predicted protein [Laccaria bicolor S238N-H82]|eukprot:XP_001874196.1 predicted protein [Laccaria bicolor S238N-H82]